MKEFTLTVGLSDADIVGSDNRALQAAVDAAAAAGGGLVHVRAGTYTMHDSLHLRSQVRIVGEGEKTILAKAPSVRTSLVGYLGYGHYDIFVSEPEKLRGGMGVLIYDNNAIGFYQTVATLTWQDGNRFGITRMLNHDYDGANGGSVVSVYSVVSGCNVEDAAVENLVVDGRREENEPLNGCRGSGVFLLQAHHVSLQGLLVRQFNGEGIGFQQCVHTFIEDCVVEDNSGNGLHPGSGSVGPIIRGCTFRRNGVGGVFYCLRVAWSLLEDCLIEDNAGIGISIGGRDTDHWLRRNVVRKNGQYGLYFRPGDVEMAGHRCLFEQNTLEGNCAAEFDAEVFLDAAVHDVHLVNNTITVSPRGGTGVGIRVGPQARDIAISGNEISGRLSAPVEVLGPRESVRFDMPTRRLAVGPDAAPEHAARHLFA